MPQPKFDAFLSYSLDSDERAARTVQGFLHRFAKPWYRARAVRIFRDKTNLTVAPALWPAIEQALLRSKYFILLASPSSARSPWVRRELATWHSRPGRSRPFIVLCDGEIAWNAERDNIDWDRTTALPSEAREYLAEMPLYADLRWLSAVNAVRWRDPRLCDSLAPLAASLRGVPLESLVAEDLLQYRRGRRLRRLAITALLALTVLAGWATREAIDSGLVARERGLEASYNLAGRLEQEASLALEMASVSREQHHYENAWLLTLAALEQPMPTGRALPVSMGRLLDVGLQRQAFRRLWTSPSTPGLFSGVAMSADTSLLAATVGAMQYDPGVFVFDRSSGRLRQEIGLSTWLSIAMSPDHDHLAVGTVEGLTVRDIRTGEVVWGPDTKEWTTVTTFSPDGRLLAWVNANSPTVEVWDVIARAPSSRYSLSSGVVRSVAFDASTARLAAGDDSGAIHVWRMGGPQEIARLMGHTGAVSGLAFAPNDEDRLASCSWDGKLLLWDVGRQLQVQALLQRPEVPLHAVEFAPDGSMLACGGQAGLQAWTIHDGTPREAWTSEPAEVVSVAFSSDNAYLLAGGDGLRQLNASDGTPVAYIDGHSARPVGTIMDSTGQYLVSWDQRELFLWTLVPGAQPRYERLARSVGDARFTSSGDLLLALTAGHVELRSIPGCETKRRWKVPSPAGLEAMCLSPDGTKVAIEGERGDISLYDLSADQVLATLAGPGEWVAAMAFAPDGRWFASMNRDSRIRLWSVPSLKQEGEWSVAAWRAHSLAFHGGLLAWGSGDGRIQLWDLDEQRNVGQLDGAQWDVSTLAISPDGALLAAAGNGAICLWELSSRGLLGVLEGHAGPTSALGFDATGQRLASGDSDNRVRLWDCNMAGPWQRRIQGPLAWDAASELVALRPGAEVTELRRIDGEIRGTPRPIKNTDYLALTADGTSAATISDTNLHVWNTENGQPCVDETYFFEKVPCAAFDRRGRLLVLGTGDLFRSMNNDIWVWDLQAQRRIAVLEGHTKCVDFVAVDETYVASASRDGTIRVWDLATGQPRYQIETEASCLAILPEREILAFGKPDTGQIALAQLRTGSLVGELPGSGPTVVCLTSSGDGSVLAAGTAAGTIDLWELSSRTHVAQLRAEGELNQVLFRDDGRALGCWSTYGCRQWDLSPLFTELSAPLRESTIQAVCLRSFSLLERTLAGTAIERSVQTPEFSRYMTEHRSSHRRLQALSDSVWSRLIASDSER